MVLVVTEILVYVIVKDSVFVVVRTCRLSPYPEYDNAPPTTTDSSASATSRVMVFVGGYLNE
jgi:hypothetical protein